VILHIDSAASMTLIIDFANLSLTSILFIFTFRIVGRIVKLSLKLTEGDSATYGVAFLAVTGAYFGYVGLSFKYLIIFCIAVALCFLVSTKLSNLRDYPKGLVTKLWRRFLHNATIYLIFASPTIIFFAPSIFKWGIGVNSIGNLDPLMYATLARHVNEHGFSTQNDLINLDLGQNATWNWTGTNSLFALLQSIREFFPYSTGSTYLGFLIAIAFVTGNSYFRMVLNVRKANLSVLLIYTVGLIISFGYASQINLYMLGNGFLAQVTFMLFIPEVMRILRINNFAKKEIGQNSKESVNRNKEDYFSIAFILGSIFTIYFAGGVVAMFGILIVITVFSIYALLNRFRQNDSTVISFTSFAPLKTILFASLIFLVCAFPSLKFIKVYGLKTLSSVTPTWTIPKIDAFSILPGIPMCQPIPDATNCKTSVSVLAVVLAAIILIYTIGSKRLGSLEGRQRILLYKIFIVLTFVLSTQTNSYQEWKILTFIQTPILCGLIPALLINRVFFKVKALSPLSNRRLQMIVVALLFITVIDVSSRASRMWEKSIWSYGSPQGVRDLFDSKTLRGLTGVNINAPGPEGMQINLYVPTASRLIISEGTYFTPLPPKYKYTIVNKSSIIWTSGIQIKSLNSNYGLIEEVSRG